MRLPLSFAALLLLSCSSASAAEPTAFKSGAFDPPHPAPEFSLQGSDGTEVSVAEYRGKVVVLEFGFTFCPKVCPVTLGKLMNVHKQLGDAARDVQVIFVTVDPARDTPERLREYLANFNPTFVGATGTPEALKAMQNTYGVVATQAASENKALGYEVHHTSSIYLIDRHGKLRVMVPFGKSADHVVHDLKLLLAEK